MKPAKWNTSPLGELVTMHSGGTPSRDNPAYWNGDIPWFSGKDLKTPYLSDSIEHITTKALGHGARLSPAGTLLVLVRGMTLMKEVPVGILRCEAAFNQDVKALLPHEKSLDAKYLAYFLMADNARIRNLVTTAGHGTGRLPIETLEEYPVPFPPLPEQRKIADILTTWDEALEKLDALVVAKERRNKALMQQLLMGKKRVNEHSTKPWVLVRFEDLLRKEDRYIEFDDEYLYRLVSIRRGSGGVFFREAINGSNIKTKVMKKVLSGDFLISRMQVVHGALGMVHENCDGFYASDSYEVLVAKDPKKLHMPFLDWMSRQRSFWYLTYICSHGVHIEKMTFNLEDFMRKLIKIPSDIEEQRQIAAILDDCGQELNILCAQRVALDQQKRGLMQRLLTGRVRVHAEKESRHA